MYLSSLSSRDHRRLITLALIFLAFLAKIIIHYEAGSLVEDKKLRCRGIEVSIMNTNEE